MPKRQVVAPGDPHQFGEFSIDSPRSATVMDLQAFSISNEFTQTHCLYAFQFTSYTAWSSYPEKYPAPTPIEPVREIMLRLYKVLPEFPRLMMAPTYQEFFSFIYPDTVESNHRECTLLFARMLGKTSQVGYRWAAPDQHQIQHGVLHPTVHAMIRQAMSLRLTYIQLYGSADGERRARACFWKAVIFTVLARQNRVYEKLKKYVDPSIFKAAESIFPQSATLPARRRVNKVKPQ